MSDSLSEFALVPDIELDVGEQVDLRQLCNFGEVVSLFWVDVRFEVPVVGLLSVDGFFRIEVRPDAPFP